jgi:hypothetical protein
VEDLCKDMVNSDLMLAQEELDLKAKRNGRLPA